jgi:hypothetical protein
MQALRALPKLQQSMSLQRGYAISQPLRAIDTNNDDADDVVNWRELSRPSGSGSLTLLDTQAEVGADGDVVSAFEKTWSDAISDFEDGKIYDHAGDKNVTTFTYEDSYKSYNSNFILYGALGLGCLFGIGGGFGRNPSDSYKERCDLRDKRRTALDRNSVQF